MRAFCLSVAGLFLYLPAISHGEVDREYLAQLKSRAKALRLAERPEWRKLLHVLPNALWPGVHGLVDSPGFNLAPGGKNDPQAELDVSTRHAEIRLAP